MTRGPDNPERSGGIFEIAQRAGISLQLGREEVFEDQTFLDFSNEYRAWALQRDNALIQYLAQTPRLFRAYTPYSTRVFSLASQLAWYLDELVISDPLIDWILPNADPAPGGLEINKRFTVLAIQLLNTLRPALDNGFILLAGPNIIPKLPQDVPEFAAELLENDDLRKQLEEAVEYGLRVATESGIEWTIYEFKLDASRGWGFWPNQPIGPGSVYSPAIDLWTSFPRAKRAEIEAALPPFGRIDIDKSLAREIYRSIYSAEVAHSLGATLIFDRNADALALELAGKRHVDVWRQGIVVGSMQLALPYLEGITADRLLGLRSELPESFVAFRASLADMVRIASEEDPDHAYEIARLVAEKELGPAVAGLQADMKAVARKARVVGYGAPLLAALGTRTSDDQSFTAPVERRDGEREGTGGPAC